MKLSNKLMPYKAVADMIAKSFGNICEVIIHDLSTPENSVVYVANGNVTNRKIGQSFDHLVKQVLLSKDFKDDYKANYNFISDAGKKIKSSTSLIRDEENQVIGALCINMEIEQFAHMKSFLDSLFGDAEPQDTATPKINISNQAEKESQVEPFNNIMEIIDDLIDKTIGNRDVDAFKKDDNIGIISFMYEKGIFLAKGSVDKVAEKLKISPVTVYSYLDKIKKMDNH